MRMMPSIFLLKAHTEQIADFGLNGTRNSKISLYRAYRGKYRHSNYIPPICCIIIRSDVLQFNLSLSFHSLYLNSFFALRYAAATMPA